MSTVLYQFLGFQSVMLMYLSFAITSDNSLNQHFPILRHPLDSTDHFVHPCEFLVSRHVKLLESREIEWPTRRDDPAITSSRGVEELGFFTFLRRRKEWPNLVELRCDRVELASQGIYLGL